jgi:hypothetical protein
MPQIKIDNILGGQAPMSHFAMQGQFRASLGIDPAQPIDDGDGIYSTVASGLLRPSASEKFSGSVITSAPLWIKSTPKTSFTYVQDANGSAYAVTADMVTVTALADGGTLTGSIGNGMEYYDNYLYFIKNTDVARYGPLNSPDATFDGDYWTGNLTKTALTNTTYPTTYKNKLAIPNHPTCRHVDGRLYIGDVVGNTGSISYIQTSKTSVEGDTNDGSTYDAMHFGYGLWPTSIETYGELLAIALYEGSSGLLRQPRAKIAFWDTVSEKAEKIVWVEFPDTLITAMKNVDGILYVVSGNVSNQGFRVSRFVGGYSFEEIYYSETGEPCLQGAIDGVLNRVLIGSYTTVPESHGCVYSYGLQKQALSGGTFNIMKATGGNSSTSVTSLLVADNVSMGFYVPIIGWTQAGDGSTAVSHGLDKQGSNYSNGNVWWSSLYRIGQHFKILRIVIPLAQAVGANMTLVPKIYIDDGVGTTATLTTINNTNYAGSQRQIIYRPNGVEGRNNFWIELKWSGSALLTVGLPITIDYELINE